MHAGLNDYLTKPVEPRILAAALVSWMTARAPSCEPEWPENVSRTLRAGSSAELRTLADRLSQDA